jgi:hypothetical protein
MGDKVKLLLGVAVDGDMANSINKDIQELGHLIFKLIL